MVDAKNTYRIREFAQLAGVTVRALHHYDRLGLLKPARSSGGYRAYTAADLPRLEQIVAMKLIGVPLKRISALLAGPPAELERVLRVQRKALEEKRRLLDLAIDAIRSAECNPDANTLAKIIEVIEVQSKPHWMDKYFREDAQDALHERRAEWTPELQARAEGAWTDLFRDIEAAVDEEPSSPRAQALVARWEESLAAFLGGRQELVHGVKALYADRPNWPADFEERMKPFMDERVWEFFRRGVAARNAARSRM